MKNLHPLLTAIVFLIVLLSCQSDESSIEKLFNSYQSALRTKDYSTICNALDRKTVAMFQEMADLAKAADSLKLSRSALFVRYQVLLIRQRLEKEELLRMSWEDVCRVGTVTMYSSPEVLNSELGISKFKDDQAVYYLKIDGKQTEYPLFFVKEDDGWKMNAAKWFSQISKMSLGASLFSDADDRAASVKALEMRAAEATQKPLKDNIWSPPSSW